MNNDNQILLLNSNIITFILTLITLKVCQIALNMYPSGSNLIFLVLLFCLYASYAYSQTVETFKHKTQSFLKIFDIVLLIFSVMTLLSIIIINLNTVYFQILVSIIYFIFIIKFLIIVIPTFIRDVTNIIKSIINANKEN